QGSGIHVFVVSEGTGDAGEFYKTACCKVQNVAFFKGASRCMIETLRDVSIQHKLGFLIDTDIDGLDRIMTGTTWSKAIAVRLEPGFPFGFQGELGQHLRRSIEDRRNPQRALFRRILRLANPDA